MIRVKNVSFAHGRKAILKDISLSADSGKITAVMGCNGAGKTTLMRLLCAELPVQSGNVNIDGRDLADWNRKDLALRRAVMTQNARLSFSYAAVDVVLLGRLPVHNGAVNADDARAAYHLLDLVSAGHLAERDFLTLSTGEQQRIQLARALAQIRGKDDESLRGKYLLLDEPNSGLDIKQQDRMLRLLRRLADEFGLSVTIIIHDLNLAAQFADSICLLYNGERLAFGTPWDVLTSSNISTAFGLDVEVYKHPHHGQPFVLNAPDQQGGAGAPFGAPVDSTNDKSLVAACDKAINPRLQF